MYSPLAQFLIIFPILCHVPSIDQASNGQLEERTTTHHFEPLAGQKVAIFKDTLFEYGSPGATLQIAKIVAINREAKDLDDAFTVVNLDTVVEQYRQWYALLPHIKPFYAVKCNNDPVLLSVLSQLGTGFDAASHNEIDTLIKNGLATGDDIVYANPCKTRAAIRQAEKMGVRRMTFDSIEELVKIRGMHSLPESKTVYSLITKMTHFLGSK